MLRYGIEAPYVPLSFIAATVVFAVIGIITTDVVWLAVALVFLLQAAIFLYTTIWGKLRIWSRLLDDLNLRGDESLLDLGCGRGAVLVTAAERLPRGTAVGIDLWRSQDQSGNSPEVAEGNAAAAGVADRVRLDTGDMTKLPYEDGTFDVVTSALAVHNIASAVGRETAVREALRVLRPGGRLVIVDFRHVKDYQRVAADQHDVKVRGLGPGYWYGGPWSASSALLATKT